MEKKLQQLTDCITTLSLIGDSVKWSMNANDVSKYGKQIRKSCLRAIELSAEIEAMQKSAPKSKIKK